MLKPLLLAAALAALPAVACAEPIPAQTGQITDPYRVMTDHERSSFYDLESDRPRNAAPVVFLVLPDFPTDDSMSTFVADVVQQWGLNGRGPAYLVVVNKAHGAVRIGVGRHLAGRLSAEQIDAIIAEAQTVTKGYHLSEVMNLVEADIDNRAFKRTPAPQVVDASDDGATVWDAMHSLWVWYAFLIIALGLYGIVAQRALNIKGFREEQKLAERERELAAIMNQTHGGQSATNSDSLPLRRRTGT